MKEDLVWSMDLWSLKKAIEIGWRSSVGEGLGFGRFTVGGKSIDNGQREEGVVLKKNQDPI